MALTNKLTAIADAIREKTGGTAQLSLDQMATEIANMSGGFAYADELYSADDVSITYTSTTAGTAKTITGITNLCKYPFIAVIIENTDTRAGSLKFMRSCTIIGNSAYATGGSTVTRYGVEQYYNSSGTLTNLSSTSYGLWGYSFSNTTSLIIRGRCNATYYTSLTGTYKVRVLGIKL